ncbi:hypothetical protein FAVG1_02697 [Fusarium avenaceum]|nr:hypothetical protein FAVG1_02697 [Fusarium avenaceum]
MDPSSTRFQWRKSPHGIWERDIDECEEFYWSYTKKSNGCYPITGCASILAKAPSADQSRVEQALRSAWTFLRYKHPTLSSRIEPQDGIGRFKRVYSPFYTDEDVKHWLSSTFKVVTTDQSPMHWFNNEAPLFDVPTLYVILSKQEASSYTLFLRCPHDVTDGVGIIHLIGQLIDQSAVAYEDSSEYLYALPDKDLHFRLSPSLRVAASIPDVLSETQMQKWDDIQSKNGEMYGHSGLLSLPPSPSSYKSHDGPMTPEHIAIILSDTVSKRIFTDCKAIAPGVNVTHVFTSALALALKDFQPRKQDSYPVRYVGRAMINLRPYCNPPYNSPDHVAASYHAVSAQALGIDLEVPGLTDDDGSGPALFSQVAVQVRDSFSQLKSEPSEGVHEQVLMAPLAFKGLYPPPGSDPHIVSDPPFCPVSMSSIGNLSTIVQRSNEVFEVTKVWAASQSIAAGVAVFLQTWEGRIELSSVFNPQYHNEGYVLNFLEAILGRVSAGLHIEDESVKVVAK